MNKINVEPQCIFLPQPMYIIGTNNEDGQPNFCVITWVSFAWDGCPQITLGIGGTKLTKTNILRDRRFSANLVGEDMIWLADYFGSTKGENGLKNEVEYTYSRGEKVDVPIIDCSRWIFECELNKAIELDDGHIIVGKVINIQIDEELRDMNLSKIDLREVKPAIYTSGYFSVGEKLGDMGEWKKHLLDDQVNESRLCI